MYINDLGDSPLIVQQNTCGKKSKMDESSNGNRGDLCSIAAEDAQNVTQLCALLLLVITLSLILVKAFSWWFLPTGTPYRKIDSNTLFILVFGLAFFLFVIVLHWSNINACWGLRSNHTANIHSNVVA